MPFAPATLREQLLQPEIHITNRRVTLIPILFLLVVGGLILLAWPHPAHGTAVIVVTTSTDNDVNDGACSLREAIIASNTDASYHGCAAPGAGVDDSINFNIGAGTPVINVGSTPLPFITQRVTINGDTGGATRIELHGPGGPPTHAADGLTIDALGTTIRNLVINNFQDDGILISSGDVTLQGSFIGTDFTGTVPEGNEGMGVQIFGGAGRTSGVVIGGTNGGNGCTGNCNVISANAKFGILVESNTDNVLISGNFIGTDATGTDQSGGEGMGNQFGGVYVDGASTSIGGDGSGNACTGACNLISGNENFGVLTSSLATSPSIHGNYIGTNVDSSAPLSNGTGVEVDGDDAMIGGGTVPADSNVISGNSDNGILIKGSATVRGNYIGTSRSGTAALSNGVGIYVDSGATAAIGGPPSNVGNLISGNENGIYTKGSIIVTGNLIGTDISAGTALPNASGIYTDTGSTGTIGGSGPGETNIISGNNWGIKMEGGSGFTILGNIIGAQADRSSPLGNDTGIQVSSGNNLIGGAAAGDENVIAFNEDGVYFSGGTNLTRANSIHDNEEYGVAVAGLTDETISANSIYNNATKGIYLMIGANHNILAPVIATASSSAASGTACDNCTIEVFSDSDGQGRTYEGSTIADGSGNWTFHGSISGPDVTATATNTGGNTSEFSQPFDLTATPTPSSTRSPTPSPTPAEGAFIWGDNDCSGLVAGPDALLDLIFAAGLQSASVASGANDCVVGGTLAGPTIWGDVDCSGQNRRSGCVRDPAVCCGSRTDNSRGLSSY